MSLFSRLRTRFSKPCPPGGEDERKLLEALWELQQDFDTLESLFNMTSDPDMIDYYVHQHKALDARYAYLIKQARAMGVTYHPRARETAVR